MKTGHCPELPPNGNRPQAMSHDVAPAAIQSPSGFGTSTERNAAGTAPSSYRVAVDASLDDDGARSLWGEAAHASAFNHPVWWRAAIDAFGRKRRLLVIRVRHGDATVGLWPFWRKRLGPSEGFAGIVEPAGARVTDYCTPLLQRDHATPAVLQMMLQAISAEVGPATLLLLPKVPQHVFSTEMVRQFAGQRGLLLDIRPRPCPGIELPATYDALEQRWSSNLRADVRRRIRRLDEAGKLEFVTAGTREEIRSMLPRLFAMHVANWSARTGFSDLATDAMPRFIEAVAAGLPMTSLSATEVRLNGVPISCHFGFRDHRAMLWYKPAFDIAWANHAPGKVHIAMAARQCIADGLGLLDFMQGEEPYKKQWGDLTTATNSFALARPIAYPIWAWNTRIRRFAAEYRS
jgi:CelD/BcsL family acetyltransferase involved in cellulose biosynthesis